MIKLLLLLALLLSSCATYNLDGYYHQDKYDWWDYECGRLYWRIPNRLCRYRVPELAKMLDGAMENYDIVYGRYWSKTKGWERHVWIERKGKKLDPSVLDISNWRYREGSRRRVKNRKE